MEIVDVLVVRIIYWTLRYKNMKDRPWEVELKKVREIVKSLVTALEKPGNDSIEQGFIDRLEMQIRLEIKMKTK